MNQQQTSSTTLVVAGVSKTLGGVKLFTDVSLQLQQGQSLAVIGESGSGKSTLLHLMAGLDKPDTGEVYWAGTAIHTLNTNQIAARRLRHVGLVFQAYYLMPHLNAQQNVELPFLLAGENPTTQGAFNCWIKWVLVTNPEATRANCRVENSSAWQLHAPWP